MTTSSPAPLDPATPGEAVLPMRNKRRAMDAALVLASQGIQSVIHSPGEALGWRLAIAQADQARAEAALVLYHQENRGWRWREKWDPAHQLFHPGVVGWVFALALLHWLDDASGGGWRKAGIMDRALVHGGQWWRLATAVTLHADFGHLATNLALGFIVIGMAMGRYGAGIALLFSFLAGIMGNVAGLLLYAKPYQGLGASGMVMGGLGLLTVQTMSLLRRNPRGSRWLMTGICGGIFIFLLVGVDPSSDVVAHTGGLVGGALLGATVATVPGEKLQRNWVQTACLAVLTLFVALVWWQAWR